VYLLKCGQKKQETILSNAIAIQASTKTKPGHGHVGSNIFCREHFKNLLSLINRKLYILVILGSIHLQRI
jgi:hypothetical protein